MDNAKGPLVTIGIPYYNSEQYLEATLKSAVEQDYSHIEVICLDDGSTDDGRSIVDGFAEIDPRVRSLSFGVNLGVSAARNRILRDSAGKYIYFLDSDDRIRFDTVRRCVEMFEAQVLDLVTFNSAFFSDEEDVIATSRKNPVLAGKYPEVMSGTDFFCRMNEQGEYRVALMRYMIRREFLLSKGLVFAEKIRCYEDAPFSFACYLLAGRVGYINDTFHSYRIRNESIITSTKDDIRFHGFFMGYCEKLKFLSDFVSEDERITCSINKRLKRALNNAKAYYRPEFAELFENRFDDFLANQMFRLFVQAMKQPVTLKKLKDLRVKHEGLKTAHLKLLDEKKRRSRRPEQRVLKLIRCFRKKYFRQV